jgi:hypothetical protein
MTCYVNSFGRLNLLIAAVIVMSDDFYLQKEKNLHF